MANIFGTSGNDNLFDTNGDDIVSGFGGNDFIVGSAGNDHLYGDDGDDELYDDSGSNALIGGRGNDRLVSASFASGQFVSGGEGDDEMILDSEMGIFAEGGDGDDSFVFFGGGVSMTGGAGRDLYSFQAQSYATPGALVLDFAAGEGGDRIDLASLIDGVTNYAGGNPFTKGYFRIVQQGSDAVIEYDVFNDVPGDQLFVPVLTLLGTAAIQLRAENFLGFSPFSALPYGNRINGTASADLLFGTLANDSIYGLGSNDTLYGNNGDDLIYGGAGSDRLDGQGGNDLLEGGEGNDFLDDYAGTNSLYGGAGNDYLTGRNGVGNILDGGAGNDYLISSDGIDSRAYGGAGNDSIFIADQGAVVIEGGSGKDNISFGTAAATDGTSTINGGGGNDRLRGGGNNDIFVVDGAASVSGYDAINGLDGFDTLQAASAGTQIGLTSISGVELVTANGFSGVTIIGSTAQDYLDFTGSTLVDIGRIEGRGGNDSIIGSDSDDSISGGLGADQLSGGGGADRFLYATAGEGGSNYLNADFINDFTTGWDLIDLSAIDADALVAGDQAFTFIGSAAFSGVGQVRVDVSPQGYNAIFVNVGGSLAADMQIVLINAPLPGAADFVL